MVNSDKELYRDVIIANASGLHARSAAKIAERARNGRSKIWIMKDGTKADASRTIDILTLNCGPGSTITVIIDDRADLGVLNDLVTLVESGFGE